MDNSLLGGTTKKSTADYGEYPNYFFKPKENLFDAVRKTSDASMNR